MVLRSGVCLLILFVLVDAILLSLALQKRTSWNFFWWKSFSATDSDIIRAELGRSHFFYHLEQKVLQSGIVWLKINILVQVYISINRYVHITVIMQNVGWKKITIEWLIWCKNLSKTSEIQYHVQFYFWLWFYHELIDFLIPCDSLDNACVLPLDKPQTNVYMLQLMYKSS